MKEVGEALTSFASECFGRARIVAERCDFDKAEQRFT